MTNSRFCALSARLAQCRIAALVLGVGVAAVAGGCQLAVNPYTDEIAMEAGATTPSAQQARAAEVTATIQQRDYALTEVTAQNASVTHGPLYFEDPFEDKGSDDGRFAWSGEEYLYFIHGPGCFLLRGALFPINAVVTPPWTVMVSDGRLSRRALGMEHDAVRWADEPVSK